MSLIVNLRTGDTTTEVRCQRINNDPLLEGNFLLEGVSAVELHLGNGDRFLPHTMSVPKAGIAGYYGGELITVEALAAETEAFLKELSRKKAASTEDAEAAKRNWPGIEGTTFTA